MAAQKAYNFSVSHYYFRLTTEAIRLASNKALTYYNISRVINERSGRALDLSESYDADDMRNHLRIIPTDGDTVLDLEILEPNASSIETAAVALGEALGRRMLIQDAISLMLFDLIVERNATEVLTKLGLTASEAEAYRVSLKKKDSNVIPFRP